MTLFSSQLPMKFGEKARLEYSWGTNLKENVLHFFFQLIRNVELIDLEHQLYKILYDGTQDPVQYRNELIILYKMIGHTRDIRLGRGEYMLSFMQIWVWYAYDPQLAFFAFTQFVHGERYGSWKDIKNFCQYICYKDGNEDHPLIEHACTLITAQLLHDIKRMGDKKQISLAAKWAPREKTRFRWLYTKIALRMYPQFLQTARNDEAKNAAICKAKIYLRKSLAQMNKYQKTLECTMCNEPWSKIYPPSIPSKALYKYKLALQNKTKSNKSRYKKIERYLCAASFSYFIETTPQYWTGNTLNVGELVKGALQCHTELDKKMMNQLWEIDKKKNLPLQNIIPVVDLSSSMERDHCEPLYNAIGLGIRISEIAKGEFKNRLMVFSATPSWLQFNEKQTFVDKVNMVNNTIRGLNSNIKAVIKTFISTFKATKIDNKAIKKLTIAIFSDMQADEFYKYDSLPLYDNIKKMFSQHSLREMPTILFWNVRKTNGFPASMDHKNVLLMSGNNTKMLNILTSPHSDKKEIGNAPMAIHERSYRNMLKYLNGRRYIILHNKIISKI